MYLDKLERAYLANGGQGICAITTQLVFENYPQYKNHLRDSDLASLLPMFQCCFELNNVFWNKSLGDHTPLQIINTLVKALDNPKVWPYAPDDRFKFMEHGIRYALELNIKRFYAKQDKLGDKARFGKTTIKMLVKLRDQLALNPLTADISKDLTSYVLLAKLSK